MKYDIEINKYLSIHDAEDIINHHNQGWEFKGLDSYHTDMMCIRKVITLQFENDFELMNYIEGVQVLSNFNIIVAAAESGEATYIIHNNRWEKSGKTFFDFKTERWVEI